MDFVRSNVDDILRPASGSENECIAKAFVLVDIGCQHYKENTYWPKVLEERNRTSRYGHLLVLEQRDRDNYLYSFSRGLDALGLKHGRHSPRSIEGILIHSFVPDYKMDDFFDFVLLFYKRILGFNTDDLDEGFETLSRFMNEFVNGKISSVNDNVPNPQKLLRCTRYALCDKDLFGPFMEKLIRIIDSGYRGDSRPVGCSSRFVKAFEDWFERYMIAKGRKGIRSEYQRRPRLRLSESRRLLLFISQRICQKDDELTVEWGGAELECPRPNIFLLAGTPYAMDHTIILSQICDGISVFDRFVIRLGGRQIYENKRKGAYVLFDDDGYETTELSEGYGSIVLREDIEVGPNELVTARDNGIVQVCVHNGDVLHIGDDIILVDDPDRPENAIGIDYLRRFSIISEYVEYRIVSEGRILFNISLSNSSAIVIRISGPDSKIKSLVAGPDLKNYYRTDSRCLFEIQLSDLYSQPDLLTVDVRENDSRSICKSTFAYIPGFRPEFNKEYYLDETSGSLLFGDSRIIEFATDQEALCIPLRLQNKDAVLKAPIPSIRVSFDGSSWTGPRARSFSIIDFHWDRIFIRADASKSVRLYTNLPKIELEPEVSHEYTSFNLIEFRSEIERRVYDHQPEYEISISVNSQIKRRLIRITVHNGYTFDESRKEIGFTDQTGIQAKYVLKRGDISIAEGMLHPGANALNLNDALGVTLHVFEKNPYTGSFDVEMLSKILGGHEYIHKEENGFVFVYGDKKMLFSTDTDDVAAVMKEYESKMRFNPWMKNPEARRALQNLIKPSSVASKPARPRRR